MTQDVNLCSAEKVGEGKDNMQAGDAGAWRFRGRRGLCYTCCMTLDPLINLSSCSGLVSNMEIGFPDRASVLIKSQWVHALLGTEA